MLGYVFEWISLLSLGGSEADNVCAELWPLTVHCSSPGGKMDKCETLMK